MNQNQTEQQQEVQAQFEQLELTVKQFLSKEALERYGNIKTVYRDKAIQLSVILAQAIQQGKIKRKISDEELKRILRQLQPKKGEFKIKR